MPSLKNKLATLVALVAIASPTLAVSLLTLSPAPPTLAQTNDARKADQLVLQSRQQQRRGQLILEARSLEEALEIYQKIEDWGSTKEVLNSLFYTYMILEWDEKLKRTITQLEEINTKEEAKDEKQHLYNQATKWWLLKNYSKAIFDFELLLKLIQKTKSLIEETNTLYSLGSIYLERQNYQKATYYFDQILSTENKKQLLLLDKAGQEHCLNTFLKAFDILGEIYYQQKNYLKAIQYFNELRDLAERPPVSVDETLLLPAKAYALTKLARIYIDLDDYRMAVTHLLEAIKLTEEQKTSESEKDAFRIYMEKEEFPEIRAEAFNFLGIAYLKLSQFKQAEQAFYNAVEAAETSRLDFYNEKSPNLIFDSLLYGKSHNLDLESFKVQTYFSQLLQQVLYLQNKFDAALEASERGRNRVFLERLNLRTSLLDVNSSKIDKISKIEDQLEVLKQAKAKIDQDTEEINQKINKLRDKQTDVWGKHTEYLLKLGDLSISREEREKIDWEINKIWETTRELSFLISELDKKENELRKKENELDQQISDLSSQADQLQKQTFQSPPSIEILTIQKLQAIARIRKATIVQYFIISDYNFGLLYSLFHTSSKGINLEGQLKSLSIWVIKPTGDIVFRQVDLKLLNSPSTQSIGTQVTSRQSELTQLVDSTRRSLGVVPANSETTRTLTFQADPSEMSRQLKQLHRLLIDPIADLLPTDPDQPVIFIPQGALFLVPFPALRDANNKYLIEKYTILTAPSIQVLDLTRQQKGKVTGSKGALIVGNPIMPKGLPPLDGAEIEAKAIAPLFKTQPLLGAQATKATVMQKMSQVRLIHLATHGLLDDARGLGSSIALTPSGKDDGLLTAEEILDMKLNADLVVLSACNTGRGRITGDGIVGLSRSLIAAGTPSVLVSLWSVPDDSTALLMTEFYQNLQRQPNKARALRQAMLSTMKERPNPFDWAAFTLIGEAE